jgi:hypothetical protein
MLVVFIRSDVVITNFQVHEWKDMKHVIDGGGGRKLMSECETYQCFTMPGFTI